MPPEEIEPDDVRFATERELTRVVDRLNSMALNRAEGTASDVVACAEKLVTAGRALGVPIPADAVLPALAPQGFGSMIAVLAGDCMVAAGSDDDLRPVLDALTALRRALP